MEIAVEATPSWYWLYDHLEDAGFEVKLTHPSKTKAIAYAKVKTDKVDSATLAHLLRSNLLPLSYVPEKPVRLNRALLRYRASLVTLQTRVKNKIHNILAKPFLHIPGLKQKFYRQKMLGCLAFMKKHVKA